MQLIFRDTHSVALTLIAVLSPFAAAQGMERTDTAAAILNEITVTAYHKPIVTGQQLSGQKLQSLSSTSIADALKYFAGAQIKDYGGLGGLKTINVRSLGAQHVGVFIDGIRITNAQNGTVDLGKYSLSTLESISLYNANRLNYCQSASEYASGATVYMQTRRPTTDSITLLGEIGSFGTYRGRMNLQFARKYLSGFIDGEYLSTRGNYPFRYKSKYEDTVGVRKNSDIKYLRMEGALFYKGLSSHYYLYSSERGCPGGIVRRLSDKYTNIGREWDTDIYAQASWSKKLSQMQTIKINGKYSYEYLRYNTNFPENQNTPKVDNHYWMHDAYTALSYAIGGEWWSANAGYDARVSWLDADLKRFSPVRRLDQKGVIALQGGWRGAQIATSLLYQHYRDYTEVKTGAADPLSKFTPAINLSYNQGGFGIRGWYKNIFRVPTLNDLYYTQVGNRNLKPEYTTQWNIGAEYNAAMERISLHAQVDAYINHITNRIVCLPLKGTYTWSMMNYGRTYCRGINATLQTEYSKSDWSLNLLYTLTLQNDVNRTDPEDEDTYEMPICYSPKYSSGITAGLGWRNYHLTVSELHVGKRIWSYADPEDILAPYDNIDLKLIAKWKRIIASFEVNDLLDIQYEHIPRYPMPGRSARCSITFTI